MIETRNINQSLSHLGRCSRLTRVVKALYKQSKDPTVLVPYRDSKLTRVLQNSLSSEANSFILAALSPRA
jgi:Kinesin motor domain